MQVREDREEEKKEEAWSKKKTFPLGVTNPAAPKMGGRRGGELEFERAVQKLQGPSPLNPSDPGGRRGTQGVERRHRLSGEVRKASGVPLKRGRGARAGTSTC